MGICMYTMLFSYHSNSGCYEPPSSYFRYSFAWVQLSVVGILYYTLVVYVCDDYIVKAPNDTVYERWSCHQTYYRDE